jgi:hypothetical protein
MCYWDIDRAAAIAPPPLSVHAGTRIVVRLRHPRPNEMIVPAVVFARIVPPSPGNDILKNAVNPLQAITLTPHIEINVLPPPPPTDFCQNLDPVSLDVGKCQLQLVDQINAIQASINHANAALTCLENYQQLKEGSPPESIHSSNPNGMDYQPDIKGYTCSAIAPINPDSPAGQTDSFLKQKETVEGVIQTALKEQPPVATFTILDGILTKDPKTVAKYSQYIPFDGVIKNAIGAIQTAQASLAQSYVQLLAMPDTTLTQFYYYDVPHLATATATITGTETISKTSSTISTWTATSNSYNLVLSAGLGFSNLVNRSYSVTPQFQNGNPVLDPNGNAISMVTETDNRMSVMAPEVMGSYVIPVLRRFSSKCSIGCSFLVSGGIGANLTTKTADFDTGVSLRLWDLLLTPAVHWGRETRLADGFTVGQPLGANAPSSLPTQTNWVKTFGFVFTYVIPLS